jgi:hypothetical protein
MSMEYIRRTYNVPAKRGVRIRFRGTQEGVIVSSRNAYLLVRFKDEQGKPMPLQNLHPTWEVEYLQ